MSEWTGSGQLTLCADDYAWSPATSRVIARLLEAGKLNATGCMTLRPNWPDDSRALRDLPAAAQVGLHLVLTDEAALTDGAAMPSIADRRAGQVDVAQIAAEVAAQLDAFEQAMDRPPAFVDGHQHAHYLPGIRPIVLDAVRRRAPGAWVRTCEDRPAALVSRPFRAKAIGSAFHSRRLRRDAAGQGLSTNHGFAGHYDFRSEWAALLPRFLARAGERHLVMCHPGTDERPGDDIAVARPREAAALAALPISDIAAEHGLAFATVADG